MTPKVRHIVVFGMFLLALLLYIDRICISVAKDEIAGALNLSDKAFGWVLSAFSLGYALLQIPSGALVDKLGARRVLTGIVTIWSLLTSLTGAAYNFVSLLIVRFLFGAGEAGAFPGMSRVIYSWIPLRERGLVLGLNFSGSRLGAAFAVPFVAWLISDYGWRMAFVILGGIGVVWALMWWIGFRDTPEEHSATSTEEQAEISSERSDDDASEDHVALKAVDLYGSTNMWIAIGQYFASNFTFFFALTWLFPHLKKTYQLEAMEASWYTVIPFVAGAIGCWISGWIIDYIYKRGQWNLSRKLPAIVGFCLAAAGLVASLHMSTPLSAVLMLSIAILGADMTLPPSWALCVDIGKKNAGTVSGTMNMAGNIGSFLTALAFPYLTAWTGSVNYFFYTAAMLNLMAALLWLRAKAADGLSY